MNIEGFSGDNMTVRLDGGEWLAGAGEFSDLTKLPDSMWKAMAERRKKK